MVYEADGNFALEDKTKLRLFSCFFLSFSFSLRYLSTSPRLLLSYGHGANIVTMGQFFDEIPSSFIQWIQEQHLFWVATAPLSESGHVNLSPKGLDGTFNVLDESTVWYEDMTGSVETVSHLRENGRITVMFCAFEGPPRIASPYFAYTWATVWGLDSAAGYMENAVLADHHFGTPEYEEILPVGKRNHGSRAAIMIKVHKVGSSCGFAIPFYEYKYQRTRYYNYARTCETFDVAHESQRPAEDYGLGQGQEFDPENPPEKGLRSYWKTKNSTGLDGLPALLYASKHQLGPRNDLTLERATMFYNGNSGNSGKNVAPAGWNGMVAEYDDGERSRGLGFFDMKFFTGISIGSHLQCSAAK
ncbi:hypothetical protein D9758_009836 [Tetrapyrgos nigripes]|uniref:Pyridoxamine 5'-phosphate oxidase putative domain-containing protein n=1 Tax=Tetrapyrgos nigripes TaxID=182062 RepID=A0A8H5LSA9_9AGAR|nr:hypothetical protein D9758_009836 [Tetrapyrgos nigripes]